MASVRPQSMNVAYEPVGSELHTPAASQVSRQSMRQSMGFDDQASYVGLVAGTPVDSNEKRLPRRRCGCLPRTRKGAIICGLVTFTVVLTLVLVGYFLFPRMPSNTVVGVTTDGTGFHLTFPVNNSIQSMNLKAYYNMTISTYNPNPYALYVDNLDVLVQVNVNQSVFDPLQTTNLFQFVTVSGQKAVGPAPMANQIPAGYQPSNSSQIGSAKYGSIVFPAKSNITYNMIFTLDWTPDPYVGVLKDPTVLEIAAACGITSRREPKQRYIGLHYVATATIGALKPLGFYPKTESNGGLWCPVDVSSDKISLLENKVQSGESVNDAIQEIWGIGA